jgi:hypothetical protein
VPPSPPLERDEALRRLVTRYVLGHGPTSAQDFARWSSLTLTDTRVAPRWRSSMDKLLSMPCATSLLAECPGQRCSAG